MIGTTAPHSTARTIAAVISMFVPVTAVLVSFLLWKDRLPPELASHWSDTGQANGVMTVSLFLTVALAMTGASAASSVILGVWPAASAATRRHGFLIAGIIAGAGAQAWLASAFLTMRAEDPYEVVLGGWGILGIVAAAYGLVPFSIAPKPQHVSHDLEQRIELHPNEGGAWSRTISAPLFLWGAAALLAVWAAIFAIAASNGKTTDATLGLWVIAATAVLLVALSRYRVTADWRGLRVTSSLFRIPIKRIRLENIDTVDATELVPREWGGWGYRITSGRSALILRKGPALVVTMTNARQFALTLDGPEVPAALLATLRDQQRSAGSAARESSGLSS